MTACKDSLSGKKAVSATLAGVLAVGMVPAAAFAADQPADEAEGQGVELQATDTEAFYSGSVAEVTVGGDKVSDFDGISFAADGTTKPTNVRITKIKAEGATDTITPATNLYFKVSDTGAKTVNGVKCDFVSQTGMAAATPGKYIVVAQKEYNQSITAYENVPAVTFEVTAAELPAVYVTTAANEYKSGDIVYDGSTKNNGVVLGYGDQAYTNANIDVALYKDGTATNLATDSTNVLAAGNYAYRITGKPGTLYEGLKKDISFTVGKYDIAAANLSISDKVAASAQTPTLNDVVGLPASIKPYVQLTKVSGSAVTSDKGSYTYKLEVNPNLSAADKAVADANITGSKELTYNVVTAADVTFTYNDKAWGTAAGFTSAADGSFVYSVDHSKKKTDAGYKADFDVTKIAGKYGTTDLEAGQFTVTTVDAKTGEAVTDLTKPGKYTVTVAADPAALNYAHGTSGTFKVTVEVTEGNLASANIFFTKDGENLDQTDTAELTYTGEDLSQEISVAVKSKGAYLTEGEDYTVEYKVKGEDGVYVDADGFVDAGDYQIVVKSNSYKLTDGTTLNVKVKGVAISGAVNDPTAKTYASADLGKVRVKDLKTYTKDKSTTTFLPYTGEEIAPEFEYISAVSKDGKATWSDVPAGQFKVTKVQYNAKAASSYKDADSIEAAGYYKVTIADDAKAEKTANYVIATTGIEFQVSDQKLFADVATTDWFADSVYQADSLGYMNGYEGTQFFGPNNALTRGDAAVVLYKMAGHKTGTSYTGDKKNVFSDVDNYVYYADAVAWAKDMGVITGYGDGTFKPQQNVTREEFALMLQRYAKAKGEDVTGDASALAGYADASAVDSWATDAVAWAVSSKVMGQNTEVINPGASISRAEVAAMAVRYQPKKISTILG